MGDHYSVHLDRVDPKEHGIGHMIQDAPLMLFLWTGFRDASKSMNEEKVESREVPSSKWMPHVAIGLALLLIGIIIAADNALALNLIYFAAASALLVLGAVFIWKGLGIKQKKMVWISILIGVITTIMAVVIFYYPSIASWVLLLALAVWTLGSGLFLIFGRGDKLLFDTGSITPIVMGIVSLMLAIILVFYPASGLNVVITLAGLMIAFMGLMQIAAGVIHRKEWILVTENQG
jgi:uncharacterized membrane protein HdeD (DUF308 family)